MWVVGGDYCCEWLQLVVLSVAKIIAIRPTLAVWSIVTTIANKLLSMGPRYQTLSLDCSNIYA